MAKRDQEAEPTEPTSTPGKDALALIAEKKAEIIAHASLDKARRYYAISVLDELAKALAVDAPKEPKL